MSRWFVGRERQRGRERTEAFSDAVIAIIMTLMSVELLQLPAKMEGQSLATALAHEWPAYLSYLVSFLILGQIWLTHHNMWRYIERVDQVLLTLNIGLLLFAAVIPFTTSLLAEYLLGSPSEQRLTAALYVGAVLGEAVCFNLSWWWAARRGLLDTEMDQRLVRAIARRYLLGPLLYMVAFSFVFINAVWSLILYLLLVIFYFIPGAGDLRPAQGRGALK
ncbi:DUF1211 domain-containing protein [Pleurocapsales cyanobacterium LEGE 06147]|nr:DUF1211 domain-containing protein [Pleurocapsales cyanobacterium LEGE 06147]